MQVDTGEIGTGFVVRGTGSTQLVTRNSHLKLKGSIFSNPLILLFSKVSLI